MTEIFGQTSTLVWVAAKALLLFVTVLAGFRLVRRRPLAELSVIDFVAAAAVGSIVGRVPNASDAGYLQGATTLLVILIAHDLCTRFRGEPWERRPVILLCDGLVDRAQLQRSGLTLGDLHAVLREHGLASVGEARYVVLESHGRISVVRRRAAGGTGDDLVAELTSNRPAGSVA